MTVRLLTNIGRLWTGTDVCSNAAILIHKDRIVWAGQASDLPSSVPGVIDDIVDVDHVENLGGGLVTPGLIDAHSHPVYAGNRWAELAMRTSGASSQEIASAGGGIGSTVTVTRGTDPWTLCNSVRERLRSWVLSGTTTVEAMTGFHLTRDGELADQGERRVLVGQDQHRQELAPFLQGLEQGAGIASRRVGIQDARVVAVPRQVVQEGPCASEEMAACAAFQEDIRHTGTGGLVLSDDRDSHPCLYSGGPEVHLTSGNRGRQGP